MIVSRESMIVYITCMNESKLTNAVKENLVRIRKQRGLSQRDLANKLNITQRVIAYYENESNNIPLAKVEEIAEILEVSVAELLSLQTQKSSIEDIDVRLIKKLKAINTLPKRARDTLWHTINMTLEHHTLKMK